MSSLPSKNKFLAIAVGKYTKVEINVFWLCPILLDFFFYFNFICIFLRYENTPLREKCPNTELFLVRIFLYSD